MKDGNGEMNEIWNSGVSNVLCCHRWSVRVISSNRSSLDYHAPFFTFSLNLTPEAQSIPASPDVLFCQDLLKMHARVYIGENTLKSSSNQTQLESVRIKGIRDAGSTADFRILFEILKF